MANFLPKYQVIFEPFNDLTLESIAVRGIVDGLLDKDKIENRLPIMVTTGISLKPAVLFQHFNLVGLSAGFFGDISAYDLNRFRNFMTSMVDIKYYYERVLPNFIVAAGWKRVGIIGQNIDYNNRYENLFIDKLHELDSEIELIGPFKTVYIQGQMVDEAQVELAVRQLKELDARVILIDIVPTSVVVCYLHKYGMYGPHYSYFTMNSYVFSPTDPFKYSWCSEKMLDDVMESVFLFGCQCLRFWFARFGR